MYLIIDKCPAGYVSKTGLEPCFACPKGTYQSEMSMTACFECPGNGETTKFAATSLTDCVGRLNTVSHFVKELSLSSSTNLLI